MMSSDDLLRAAWQAILRGDYAERDRLIALAKNTIEGVRRVREGKPIAVGQPIIFTPAPIITLPDRSNETIN